MHTLSMEDNGYCHSVSVRHDGYDSNVTAYYKDGELHADIQHTGFGVYAHYVQDERPVVATGDELELVGFGRFKIVTRYGMSSGWVEPRPGQRPNPNQPVTLMQVGV